MAYTTIQGNLANCSIVAVTFDVASVAANTSAQQNVTVPGVKIGDLAVVINATHSAGLQYSTNPATAADTIPLTVQNSTASPVDPASQTLYFIVFRRDGASVGKVVL
jgi:hypothetical protein